MSIDHPTTQPIVTINTYAHKQLRAELARTNTPED